MNIKKIALFSLIFIASLTLNNTIMPMEESKKRIQSAIQNLDTKIIALKKDARAEEKQNNTQQAQQNEQAAIIKALHEEMEKTSAISQQKHEMTEQAQNKYKACLEKRNKESKELYCWQFYTADCRNLREAWYNAGSEYSKAFTESSNASSAWLNASTAYNTNKFNPDNYKARQKYMSNRITYNLLKDDFKRCNRHSDTACFKDLEEELIEWNKNN